MCAIVCVYLFVSGVTQDSISSQSFYSDALEFSSFYNCEETFGGYNARMLELDRHTAASLLMEGHVFCAGSLAQCLHRWHKLHSHQKAAAFLKMGRDGVSPMIVQ